MTRPDEQAVLLHLPGATWRLSPDVVDPAGQLEQAGADPVSFEVLDADGRPGVLVVRDAAWAAVTGPGRLLRGAPPGGHPHI